MRENFTFHEVDEKQLYKFHQINSMSEAAWTERCVYYNNCSRCPMAIHQHLISTEKHYCTYGISESKFRTLMSSADCWY